MPFSTAPILVIDDEPFVRNALGRALKRAGYEVVQAASAEEALVLLEAGSYSCAVTDWQMPGSGGFGFLAGLRRLGLALPTIVMSGDDSFARTSFGPSVVGVLVKPWADSELRAIIAHAVPAVA